MDIRLEDLIPVYSDWDNSEDRENLQRFLTERNNAGFISKYQGLKWFYALQGHVPFTYNLSPQEFIPTQLFAFLEILKKSFHQLFLILFLLALLNILVFLV